MQRMWLWLIAPLIGAALPVLAQEETLTGRIQVLDAGTFMVQSTRIGLWGIAAPPSDSPAGVAATVGAFRLFDGQMATCHLTGDMDGTRTIGKCEAAGKDISALMVDQGLARDCLRQTKGRYTQQEQRASTLPDPPARDFALPSRCQAVAQDNRSAGGGGRGGGRGGGGRGH